MKNKWFQRALCMAIALFVLVSIIPANKIQVMAGVESEALGHISLSLVDMSGNPYSGVSVWLMPEDADVIVMETESDEDGSVLMDGLAAGTYYRLRVDARDIDNGFSDDGWSGPYTAATEETVIMETTEVVEENPTDDSAEGIVAEAEENIETEAAGETDAFTDTSVGTDMEAGNASDADTGTVILVGSALSNALVNLEGVLIPLDNIGDAETSAVYYEKMIQATAAPGVRLLNAVVYIDVGDSNSLSSVDGAYTVTSDTITLIGSDRIYQIVGTTETRRIVVDNGVSATIVLGDENTGESVSIYRSILKAQGVSPFTLNAGSNATLHIADGTVNAIKTEQNDSGAKYASPGITVSKGASLTINGNTGALTVVGGCYSAAIGSDYNSEGGNITINGGIITADGGRGAAGIGAGWAYKGTTSIGDITINDGTIAVTTGSGSTGGAGIGAGGSSGSGSSVDNIIINGGTIITEGYGAGIGAGNSGSSQSSSTVNNLAIHGGTITATGGYEGAGIGSALATSGGNSSSRVDKLSIDGGIITATGGSRGAGIGTGIAYTGTSMSSIGELSISGGTISAYGKSGGAGIGTAGLTSGQLGGIAYVEKINIFGNAVIEEAVGASGAGGIGAGQASSTANSYVDEIAISGGTIKKAIGGSYGAGIGAGYSSGSGSVSRVNAIAISGGTIEEAHGGGYGAGIGTGYNSSVSTIIISGGDGIFAYAGIGANGIGLGNTSIETSISISGNAKAYAFAINRPAIYNGYHNDNHNTAVSSVANGFDGQVVNAWFKTGAIESAFGGRLNLIIKSPGAANPGSFTFPAQTYYYFAFSGIEPAYLLRAAYNGTTKQIFDVTDGSMDTVPSANTFDLRVLAFGGDVEESAPPEINSVAEGDREITGTGVPEAEIEVTFPDDSTGIVTVGPDGNWSIEVPADVELKEDDEITAIQTEKGKEPSKEAETIVIGKSEPPIIAAVTEGEREITGTGIPEAEIEVTFPDGSTGTTTVGPDGNWSIEVSADVELKEDDEITAIQTEKGKDSSKEAETIVIGKSEPPIIATVTEGDREITGTGIPEAEIEVTFPDGSTGTTTVDPDGNWSIEVPERIELKKDDKITAIQTENGKKPSENAETVVIGKTSTEAGNGSNGNTTGGGSSGGGSTGSANTSNVVTVDFEVPLGFAQTDNPYVYMEVDEEGTPLGYFTPMADEDSNVTWVKVGMDSTPLGAASFNKTNPKTGDTSGCSFLVLLLASLCAVGGAASWNRKSRAEHR